LEWQIAEADRLLAEYSRVGITDEVKIAKLLQKKDKHAKHLKKYKP